MKYKIWDTVTIKDDIKMMKYEDSVSCASDFCDYEMVKLKGLKMTIREVTYNWLYTLNNCEAYWWTDTMFKNDFRFIT